VVKAFKCSSVKNKCFLYAIVGNKSVPGEIKTPFLTLFAEKFFGEKVISWY